MTKHQQKPASVLERLIFNNRPVVVLICLLISAFLFYQAAQVRPSTSFEKMIPLGHPYIQKMLEHRDDLANLGNTVRISVAAKEGDIFSKEYMETLRQIHDEVFYIQGVDRSNMKSLWSSSVRWTEVTEQGFAGGEVIPQTYDGSEESLEDLRNNILKSGQVGRLVANNFQSSIIDVPLMESYSDPEDRSRLIALDYQQFSHELEEKIRDKYQTQNPNVEIHIIGFAKKVGDLIDGLVGVVLFFFVAIGITLALLLWFTRCVKSTIAVVVTTLIAVAWQLGLLHTLGFGLDPYSMLVPFLVFAIGISHGVQKINGIAMASGQTDDPLIAARLAFRQLFVPGMVALASDAVGFVTLLLIDIGVIRELAIGASLGVAVIILTNLILLPVAISYMGISQRAVKQAREEVEELRRTVRQGNDPIEARNAAKRKAQVEAAAVILFKDAVEKCIARKEGEFRSERHRKNWRRSMDAYAVPIIGNMNVAHITTQEILRVLNQSFEDGTLWEKRTETAARLRARLEKLAARSELRHHDIIGAGVAEQFVQEARLFDLCVASRPDPSSSEATHVTEAVMFGSGRSLLLVPPAGGEPFDPKTIVVAWRNTREAARAVAEALPFLSRAETVSLVMVGNEEMGSVERAVQGEDMARHLDRHGVKVELNSVPRGKGVAATLLDEVKLSGAELLVMGAYGHSRLRQWALGGVTREVMSAATVPVLVAH